LQPNYRRTKIRRALPEDDSIAARQTERSYRFAVCGPCLQEDAAPHVRTLWQLGWLAACPKHQAILLSRCELCLYEYEDLDAPRAEVQIYSCRHDSLRFLAWLIDGWPDSLGARIGRDMLWRGLSCKRNRLLHHVLPGWPGHPWSPSPPDFAPEVHARLRSRTGGDGSSIPGLRSRSRDGKL
jgi:hypothetical protein